MYNCTLAENKLIRLWRSRLKLADEPVAGHSTATTKQIRAERHCQQKEGK